MTWTKLGQEFGDEAADLTDAEFRTHIEAVMWSNRRGLDLHVPVKDLRRFAETPNPQGAAVGLVVKGWWEDHGDSWYIGVRFADWQLERVVVEQRRNATALRQRRHRLHKAGDHSICLAQHCQDAIADVTRYETRHETSDPVRNGTVRRTTTNNLSDKRDESWAAL